MKEEEYDPVWAIWDDEQRAARRLAREFAPTRGMPCSMDSPWPMRDVLGKLVEAASVLLDDKDYDGHGWELIYEAREQARAWLRWAENSGKDGG